MKVLFIYFAIINLIVFLARGSIFCKPISRDGTEDKTSYDQSKAEYDQAFCLENMIDYSEALGRGFPGKLSGLAFKVIGAGKVLYQRYFPYVLIIQALICACPLVIWKVYSSEILHTSVKFIAEGLKNANGKTENGGENLESADKTKHDHSNETGKQSSVLAASSVRLHDIKQQISYWSTQRELIKLYFTKLLMHEMFLILIICFYLCFDIFYGLAFKSDFVCYVNKRVLVECNFPGASVLQIFWLANLVLVDLALLLNTIQLININWCMRRPSKYFFLEWSKENKETKGSGFANDSHLISAICYENLSVFPSKKALRVLQDLKSKSNESMPEKITQSGSIDSLPESESSFCTAPRPSQAGLPSDSKDHSSKCKMISDV